MQARDMLEAGMLVCFSIGWHWSTARMIRVRSSHGKSPAFVALVLTGYALGACAKYVGWIETGAFNPLIWRCVWNAVVAASDLSPVVWLRACNARARAA